MTPSDVKIVAENINDFIEVPDGINRLRKAVLTLAVSGLLVEQNDTDEDIDELIAQIKLERENGSNLKKKSKTHPVVSENEVLFDIPKSWRWVPFGSLFIDYGSGSTPSRGSDKYYAVEGFNWYKSGELNDSTLPTEAIEKVTETALKECRLRVFRPGDFLIAMYGATAGRISISAGTGTTNQAVWSGTPSKKIESRYLYYYLLQSRQILIDKSSGAAQPNISGEKILAHPFALPPLAEQKRIVKKVDEAMSRLDELESQKKEHDLVRFRLTRSAMQALGSADSKIAFAQFSELIKTPQDIKELENAILTLAVSGKIVPQTNDEGDASDLLQQIHSKIENSNTVTKRKIKTMNELESSISLPFQLPDSWTKAKLGEITYQITDGTHFTPKYVDSGIPFLSIKDISGGSLDFSNTKFISESEHVELIKRCEPKRNDILICRIGTLGRAALVNTDKAFSIFVSLGLIKYPTDLIFPEYLEMVLNSPCLYEQYDQIKAGGSHTNKLNLKEMPKLIIPLPPFAEQKRIVKKVEELTIHINHLKMVTENN